MHSSPKGAAFIARLPLDTALAAPGQRGPSSPPRHLAYPYRIRPLHPVEHRHQQFAGLEDGDGTIEIARSAHEIEKITPEALRRARKANPPTAHQTFDQSEAVPPTDHEVRLSSRIGLRTAVVHAFALLHSLHLRTSTHSSSPFRPFLYTSPHPPLNLDHICAE